MQDEFYLPAERRPAGPLAVTERLAIISVGDGMRTLHLGEVLCRAGSGEHQYCSDRPGLVLSVLFRWW